jgi:hypothetical protein
MLKIPITIEGEIPSLLRRNGPIKGMSPRFQARKDILDANPEGTRKQSAQMYPFTCVVSDIVR